MQSTSHRCGWHCQFGRVFETMLSLSLSVYLPSLSFCAPRMYSIFLLMTYPRADMMQVYHSILTTLCCKASLPEVQVPWPNDATPSTAAMAFADTTMISRVRRQSLHLQSSCYALQLRSKSNTCHSLLPKTEPMEGLAAHYNDLNLKI